MNNLSQYNIELLFSPKFLVLSRFCHFLDQIQAISGPGQIKFKFPGLPGFQVPLGTQLKRSLFVCGIPVFKYSLSYPKGQIVLTYSLFYHKDASGIEKNIHL